MREGKTAHDIKEGTLFRFHQGQYLAIHVDAAAELRYLYRSDRWDASKGAYDEKIVPYMGLKRVRETSLPKTNKRRKLRRNFFVLRPAFLMDGKLVFVDSFELLYPFEGQGDIYKEE